MQGNILFAWYFEHFVHLHISLTVTLCLRKRCFLACLILDLFSHLSHQRDKNPNLWQLLNHIKEWLRLEENSEGLTVQPLCSSSVP